MHSHIETNFILSGALGKELYLNGGTILALFAASALLVMKLWFLLKCSITFFTHKTFIFHSASSIIYWYVQRSYGSFFGEKEQRLGWCICLMVNIWSSRAGSAFGVGTVAGPNVIKFYLLPQAGAVSA
jgi:hypothetical protein